VRERQRRNAQTNAVLSEIISRQLAKGADPNSVDSRDGETLLIKAVKRGSAKAVTLLLDAGADVNKPTMDDNEYEGMTPLMFAVHEEFFTGLHMVDLLLNAGASVHATDTNGQTPLHYVSMWFGGTWPEIISMLLRRGADPNARDGFGWTPLHHVCNNCNNEDGALAVLLAAGADPNVANRDGSTPLLLAVSDSCYSEYVPHLLNAGANPNIADKQGWTPLMRAVEEHEGAECEQEVVQLLLNAGANPNAMTKKGGHTALKLAHSQIFKNILRAAGATR
jgi:ankyrin repeat protein